MTDLTDRIKQMAQEADMYADALDGSGELQRTGRTWTEVREQYFAALVAEDCARVMRDEFAKMAPTIAQAAQAGESVTHVAEMCAAAVAFKVIARYTLATPSQAG